MNPFLIKMIGIAGLVLGIAALAAGTFYPAQVAVTASLAAAGVVLLIAFSWVQFDAFRTFSRKRSTHAKVNAVLTVLFFFFIVVLLNLIVRQYYYRYDGSTARGYTLAPQSRAAAGRVDNEVHVLFFGAEGTKDFKKAAALLESYRYLNKLIVYELLDLDREPLKAKEFGVTEYNTVVARSGDKTVSGKGADEQNITNLIIRATRKKVLTVRFLQGHSEHSMDEKDRNGYGVVLKNLMSLGYKVEPLVLPEAGRVPADTDLLIIAAPKSELSGKEYEMLERYRTRGGKFFVLVDSPDQAKGLLESFNLLISEYPVYDSQNVAGTNPSVPMVNRYYDNPITRDFGLSTIFPGVHEVKSRNDNESDYVFQRMVRTSRHSWYEKNGNGKMDAGEEEGYNTIAGILSHKHQLMKAGVFGDSDFASNAYASSTGNANLFTNVVSWLLGEGALTTVAPARPEFIPMFITEEQANRVRLFAAAGIPAFICLAGIAVWYRRKNL